VARRAAVIRTTVSTFGATSAEPRLTPRLTPCSYYWSAAPRKFLRSRARNLLLPRRRTLPLSRIFACRASATPVHSATPQYWGSSPPGSDSAFGWTFPYSSYFELVATQHVMSWFSSIKKIYLELRITTCSLLYVLHIQVRTTTSY